ncbi:MAG: hypothetical protein V3S26_06100 [Acidimicrobiia bacterium]
MADSDTAFLWETEALRSSKATKGRHEQRPDRDDRDDVDWMTLREATDLTGIPVSTLRKWARRDAVPTYLEEAPVGQLRMVSLRGIRQRADELGREVKPEPPAPVRPTPPPIPSTDPEPVPEIPKTGDETDPEPVIPEGTMLVPLDAWNKMLMQLGNLHEAGQQLAEARERAAKSETETVFLRERVSEMRGELAEAKTSATRPPIVVEPVSEPEVDEPFGDILSEEEDEESTSVDIPVRNLGDIEPSDEPHVPTDQEELLTLPAYSLAMMKHVYTTWRGRPRR